ncbi:MAG: hypothetical protein NVS9B10_05640 [Nevskia sp.]
MQLAVDAEFADAARDQLAVLRAEVENQDAIGVDVLGAAGQGWVSIRGDFKNDFSRTAREEKLFPKAFSASVFLSPRAPRSLREHAFMSDAQLCVR